MADDSLMNKENVELLGTLQGKMLKEFDRRFDDKLITSADLAVLARLGMQNGWNLDPSRIPENLRDKLTSKVAFDDDEDPSVIGKIKEG